MKFKLKRTVAVLGGALLAGAVGTVAAHDADEAGEPVCIEANYMMADAMNAPFGEQGAGRVIEMNIVTGTPGITVPTPFSPANVGTDICPDDFACPGPWKPTGVLSGGQNGHAFISSAGQQGLTEFHRDGTPIRTVSYKELTGNPAGPAGFGTVPRPLGTQLMPNGNLIQAICDANFFNASNSDDDGEGGLEANHYFPPVNATDERQSNSRLLVIDQDTMEVIDEYNRPKQGDPGHDLWGCAAGIMFSDEGMYVSMFHGGAVLEIDWKAGINESSTGVGSNDPDADQDEDDLFKLDRKNNQAVVTDIIDFRLGEDENNEGWRRDSLRAISFDESGNIYATDRERSQKCERDEAGCNPGVFRQRVNIAVPDWDDEDGDGDFGYNNPNLRRSVALDPGVNVIAGIRTNRMSGPACEHVKANATTFATEYNALGYAAEEDLCDVETVLVAASAMNAGEWDSVDGCTDNPGPVPPNPCFKPGGGVVEYLTHPNWTDGGAGWGGGGCDGSPAAGADNTGCAQPVATFVYTNPGDTTPVPVDPRMLMVIHEAFGQ